MDVMADVNEKLNMHVSCKIVEICAKKAEKLIFDIDKCVNEFLSYDDKNVNKKFHSNKLFDNSVKHYESMRKSIKCAVRYLVEFYGQKQCMYRRDNFNIRDYDKHQKEAFVELQDIIKDVVSKRIKSSFSNDVVNQIINSITENL